MYGKQRKSGRGGFGRIKVAGIHGPCAVISLREKTIENIPNALRIIDLARGKERRGAESRGESRSRGAES